MKTASANGAIGGYYGKPIVKPPEWTPLIPTYFWAGGLAGACAALGLVSRVRKKHGLARTMTLAAAAGSALSGFCLIADLKKPSRFANMLRVFKPTSPMSVGVYVFSIFGGSSMAAAASELTGIATPLGRAFETIAGLVGPVMSVYTSVLISDTAMPAWLHGRESLPLLFAATSASTAGAVGLCCAPPDENGAARRLALVGAIAVRFALKRLHHELGKTQAEPYEKGRAGMLAFLAGALNIAGTIAAARGKGLAKAGGALLLAGGLAERFAVYHAGKQSAKDPKYIIAAQT
ncbi:MAG TPA: NrfD/PsrC family molybdoenzyme membrane anchor subunit [Candidatus Baltobacteraceae bacterium]